MNNSRAEKLALRAINQYRRRDVLAYLGLRYYLDNTSSSKDNWIENVAVNLPLARNPQYYIVEHFKEINPEGIIKRRQLFLPSPNDSLAETALLNECAKYPEVFGNPSNVFSYDLSSKTSRKSIFKQYIIGLRKRQSAIAKACVKYSDGIVKHTDIQNFYPSLNTTLVMKSWVKKCELAKMPKKYRMLGIKLIESYGVFSKQVGPDSILVGPMFSHFLANMILHDFDRKFEKELPSSYFRYVDDMTFVGSEHNVLKSIEIVQKELGAIGLQLHKEDSPKNITGTTKDWLRYKNDFHESKYGDSWKKLIGGLKIYLLKNPEKFSLIEAELQKRSFGLPLYHYNTLAKERTTFEKIKSIPRLFRWWIIGLGNSTDSIVNMAEYLRNKYLNELSTLSQELRNAYGFHRKSITPKIRYNIGRLVYLCSNDQLKEVENQIKEFPELKFYLELVSAILSGDVSIVLNLGADVAQAAAQIFKARKKDAFFEITKENEDRHHEIAIFLLNGVKINSFTKPLTELQKFALSGADFELMNSNNGFIRELSCLHGISEFPRHVETLESIFDEDEEFVFDALSDFQMSLS